MARIIVLIVKYTLYAALGFSAGYGIKSLVLNIKHIKLFQSQDSLKINVDDFISRYNLTSRYSRFSRSENLREIIKKRYQRCVTQPSKPFCLLSANRRLEIFRSEQADSPNVEAIESKLQNITSELEPSRIRIHSLLATFTELMESNDVRVVLIEPSFLYCLLSLERKSDMLKGGFNPGSLLGSRNVVTVGVLNEDSKKLEANNFTTEILSAGFKIMKFRKWMNRESAKSFETVHYFFVLQDVAMHVVVLYPENSYLRHASLDPKEIDFEGLLFVNEGIFENFILLPLDLTGTSVKRIFVPHDIQYFMKEIETSRTLECNSNSSGIASSVFHSNYTKEQLQKRAMITLKELKALLIPHASFLWLWSKSLLGWFSECDLFYYSPTLDLALPFRSVQGLNFTHLLDDNEVLKVLNDSQSDNVYKYEIDCHGLLVNMFILHEDKDGIWYKPSEEQRFTYPVFTLCSSQVFGEKIQVPCNPEDIFKLEFRQNKTSGATTNILSEDNRFRNETES